MLEKVKHNLATVLIVFLFIGLFFSRAILSISTILFFVIQIGFFYKEYTWNNFKANRHYLSISIVLLLCFLSFFYSTNSIEWQHRTIIKIPLLLFVLAFLTVRLTTVQVFILHHVFIFIVLGGTLYSVANYYLHYELIMEYYKEAGVMPTILYNDHIRFSWCVCIAILCCMHVHKEIERRNLQIINGLIGLWLFAFLHILGSKTGLVIAYSSIFIYVIMQFKKLSVRLRVIIITAIILFPMIAYFSFPSFKQRLHYMQYDYAQYSKGNYRSGLSDGVRVLSMQAGADITKKNLAFGVGMGDVQDDTNNWYTTNAKQLHNYEKFLPLSQYLIISAGIGLVGLLIFILSLFFPLYIAKRNLIFFLFYVPAILSFLFEIHLEGQAGVFIFGFFTMWFLYLAKNNTNEHASR